MLCAFLRRFWVKASIFNAVRDEDLRRKGVKSGRNESEMMGGNPDG